MHFRQKKSDPRWKARDSRRNEEITSKDNVKSMMNKHYKDTMLMITFVSMPVQTFSCVSMPLGIQFKILNNWPSGPDQALLSSPLQIHLLTPSFLLYRPSLLYVLLHLIFYMNSSIYLESLLTLLHLANSYSSSVSVQR